MTERLPPLNALKAFESAARHLSFKRAAAELSVTPAAISHQIKSLEDYLGIPLFRRVNRGLALTPAAQAAVPKLSEGFDALAEASAAWSWWAFRQTISAGRSRAATRKSRSSASSITA